MGKVRSIPMPWLTRLTVNVVPGPPPRFLITSPWKAWTRSRSPSRTRKLTFTVSPGTNIGTLGLGVTGSREWASIEWCYLSGFVMTDYILYTSEHQSKYTAS